MDRGRASALTSGVAPRPLENRAIAPLRPQLPAPFLCGLLALLLAGSGACGGDPGNSPGQNVFVEEQVLDLLASFQRGEARVLAQDREQPLHVWPAAWLDRTEALGTLAADGVGGVLQARAESALEFRLPVLGAGARLLLRTFVYPVDRIDLQRADPFPVIFRVLVDGQERAALKSDYVAEAGHEHPFDQLMRTLSVDLSDLEGRRPTVTLVTTRDGAPAPGPEQGAAEPVWWHASLRQSTRVPRQKASAARPNLLVICVDTLSAGRMSAFGAGRPTTPALAAWAAGGLQYRRAVSSSSWTLPATASLFTGLPPNTHGVLGDARSYLMESLATWAEALARQGLVGAAFVANPLLAQANNFHQGFSSWTNLDGEQGPSSADVDVLVDELLLFVDAQPEGARWFAYLHPMDPHAPYGAPGAARDVFVSGPVPARDLGGHLPQRLQNELEPPLTPDERQYVIDLYDGELAYLDTQLGRLLAQLEARDLDANTVVVLTADHGEELFELGRLGHGYDLNEPMLHVPLVLVGPGIPQGVIDTPVSSASLAATLLRLAGAPPVPGAAPSLLPPPGDTGPVFALTRTHLFGPRRVLVSAVDAQGRKVVLELSEDDAATEPVAVRRHRLQGPGGEALDLDPADLSEAEAMVFDALVAAALHWANETARARPGDVQPNVDVNEALRQVGYIGEDRDR